ncbi:DNA polymerase alpha/epsilon subunit B-domain-containing protein [Chlamydoabsidia padenii]|nr:DNA polymerase alpha/epsilon subunit B-domain-containing protein [Chlamydoabsidia padenii]
MPLKKISRTIYLLFTKQNGLHVQTDAMRYLEDILKNDSDFTITLDKIFKAYRKWNEDQSVVIVDKASLEQVIQALQTEAAAATVKTPFQKDYDLQDSLQDMSINEAVDTIDVTQHLHVADAFKMPRLQYDYHRKLFLTSPHPTTLLGTATDKAEMYRDRMNLVKQRLLRNEQFCATSMHLDKESYIKITPIKALMGRENQSFSIFGMMTQLDEGKIFLEDEDAHIELNLSDVAYGTGLFTDGAYVIVTGQYKEDQVFHAQRIEFPPAEPRIMTDTLFPHVDFTGLPKIMVDETQLKIEETNNDKISFVIISDMFLDQPKAMNALRRIFERYEDQTIPLAFILIGNFSSEANISSGMEATRYKDNFMALADMIHEFTSIATHSNFVFVPGSRDPWGGNILPQPSIPDIFTSRMRQKVKHLTFATNPCRIRYCTQDIVIFREDILNRLWRNALLDPNTFEEPEPVKHMIRTVIDQGHLCPLPLTVRAIYWSHDHAMRLYPSPQALVLADQCESFSINYEGVHCLNPGSFVNSDYAYTVYYPSKGVSERRFANEY